MATRTAGMAVVNVAALHPAIQVSYMSEFNDACMKLSFADIAKL